MTVFLWSICVLIVILCGIAAYVTVAVAKHVEHSSEVDEPISEKVAQHPFLLNPIIIMYLVIGVFMTVIIFGFHVANR